MQVTNAALGELILSNILSEERKMRIPAYMSERKAGKLCNEVYECLKAGSITVDNALTRLEQLSPFMSTAQFVKHLDFLHQVRRGEWDARKA